MQTNHLWITGPEAWAAFANEHPELGYQGGRQQFYNFLVI